MELKSMYQGIKRVDFLDDLFREIARRSDELLLDDFRYDVLRVQIKAAIDDYYANAVDNEKYSTTISVNEVANRVLKYHEYRTIKSKKAIDYADTKGLSMDETLVKVEEFMDVIYQSEIKKKPKAYRNKALVDFVKATDFISKFEDYVSKEDILKEEVIND